MKQLRQEYVSMAVRTGLFVLLSGILAATANAQSTLLKASQKGEVAVSVDGVPTKYKLKNDFLKDPFDEGDGAHVVIDLGDETSEDSIILSVVDNDGFELATIFEFDNVTRVDARETPHRKWFLAIGAGEETIPDEKLGDVILGDAVLSGFIEYDDEGNPVRVSAALYWNGDSDFGPVVFQGKITGKNQFVPAS